MPHAFGDDERVAAKSHGDVVVPTGKATALVAVEPEFSLQALHDEADELLLCRTARYGDEEVVGRLRLALAPLNEKPEGLLLALGYKAARWSLAGAAALSLMACGGETELAALLTPDAVRPRALTTSPSPGPTASSAAISPWGTWTTDPQRATYRLMSRGLHLEVTVSLFAPEYMQPLSAWCPPPPETAQWPRRRTRSSPTSTAAKWMDLCRSLELRPREGRPEVASGRQHGTEFELRDTGSVLFPGLRLSEPLLPPVSCCCRNERWRCRAPCRARSNCEIDPRALTRQAGIRPRRDCR
jgi:hypothetical protein